MRINASLRSTMHKFITKNPQIGSFIYDAVNFSKRGSQNKALKAFKKRGFQPQVILDVGANRGEWSRHIKTVFNEADFFLIEPQVEMKPFLDKFCADFPGSKWFLVGAGRESGELSLTIWDDLAGSSFLPQESEQFTHFANRIVPIVTIDELICKQAMPIPDLVKMDVQGFEIEALNGATRCFGATELFIIEVSFFHFLPEQPLFYEVVHFMHNQGYVVYDVPRLSFRPLDGALAQADICFAKQDGMLRASHRWV